MNSRHSKLNEWHHTTENQRSLKQRVMVYWGFFLMRRSLLSPYLILDFIVGKLLLFPSAIIAVFIRQCFEITLKQKQCMCACAFERACVRACVRKRDFERDVILAQSLVISAQCGSQQYWIICCHQILLHHHLLFMVLLKNGRSSQILPPSWLYQTIKVFNIRL